MKILFFIISIFLSSPSWSETLTMDDLVERNETYYKKFSDIPFTGEISDIESGKFVNGKKEGEWLDFFENGQLSSKGFEKDWESYGVWQYFNRDGSLKRTETWENGRRIYCEGDC